MEKQGHQGNPYRLMPQRYGGTACHVPGNSQNHILATSSGTKDDQPPESDMSLSQWLHPSRTPRSYTELLNEDSVYLEGDPIVNVTETRAIENTCNIQKIETSCNIVKSGNSCGFKTPGVSSFHIEAWKTEQSAQIQSRNSHDVSARFVRPQAQGVSFEKSIPAHSQNQLQQNWTTGKQEPTEDNCCIAKIYPRSRPSPSGSQSRRQRTARQRAAATDRERRLRITDKINALQELLPNPGQGSQESILHDIIAHVKFLQLQIKELSRSRLGGELTPHQFISIEGYGHYIHHEQMMNEPLEEMLAKLLETDPSAASQLFESKGLCLLPMALVESLH